jgi:hypothetical protein
MAASDVRQSTARKDANAEAEHSGEDTADCGDSVRSACCAVVNC